MGNKDIITGLATGRWSSIIQMLSTKAIEMISSCWKKSGMINISKWRYLLIGIIVLRKSKNCCPQSDTGWYWVDTFSKEDLDELKGHYVEIEIAGEDDKTTVEEIYQKPQVLRANQVYGMKAITNTGEYEEDPCVSFISAIESGVSNKSLYQPQFQELYDKLSDSNGEIARDNIRIIGVVVTGDADSLGLLKDADYIKASSLGIVVNKY